MGKLLSRRFSFTRKITLNDPRYTWYQIQDVLTPECIGMEARGFLFVAVKIVAKRHILWICADDVGCADYLRAEDTEDEAYVADYVAKLKRKGDYAKVSIYQFGGPEDNDDELWERLNRRVD